MGKTGSINRKDTGLERLPIGNGLHILYDKADTWLAVEDDDWTSYDRAGGVAMDVETVDALIEVLQQVKKHLSRGQDEAQQSD